MKPSPKKSTAARKLRKTPARNTLPVSDELFQQVYDSPSSLPGRHKWVTSDQDVREIEKLLGMKPKTIGAPLWLSGDSRNCRECKRETSWLDIISSSLRKVHDKAMVAEVILGEQRYVNVEVPHSIADLYCYGCGAKIPDLRSFKCHNWAYAKGRLAAIVKQIAAAKG